MTWKAKILVSLSMVAVCMAAATQRAEATEPEHCGPGFVYFPDCPCSGSGEANFCQVWSWEHNCGAVNYQGCYGGGYVCLFGNS